MRYQIYKEPRDQQYYFKLRAKNGWPLLTSKGHRTNKNAADTARKVKRVTLIDKGFERRQTESGRYYYEIHDEKQVVLATSRLYASRTTMNRAIRNVKRIAPESKIIEGDYVIKQKTATIVKKQQLIT